MDYCITKVENKELGFRLLSEPIGTLHDVQKIAESGVPYFHTLNITGGIYLRIFSILYDFYIDAGFLVS